MRELLEILFATVISMAVFGLLVYIFNDQLSSPSKAGIVFGVAIAMATSIGYRMNGVFGSRS